jgi:hypothetical protein
MKSLEGMIVRIDREALKFIPSFKPPHTSLAWFYFLHADGGWYEDAPRALRQKRGSPEMLHRLGMQMPSVDSDEFQKIPIKYAGIVEPPFGASLVANPFKDLGRRVEGHFKQEILKPKPKPKGKLRGYVLFDRDMGEILWRKDCPQNLRALNYQLLEAVYADK